MHQQITPSKQAAIAHYQQLAAEARAFREEQERNDRLIAQVQADALIDRIRTHNESGCFAEPSWMDRANDAFRREFGTWALAGALAVGVFFGFGAGAMVALVWGGA